MISVGNVIMRLAAATAPERATTPAPPMELIKEPTGIAVYAPDGRPVPAQFRVLERWREFGSDGSVKWLLVALLKSPSTWLVPVSHPSPLGGA